MRQYISFILLGATLLGLSNCSTFKPFYSFETMSREELALYNFELAAGEQVYCFDEVRTGSHMKKRFCATQNELTGALDHSFDRLSVIDANSAIVDGQNVYSQQ